MLVNIWVKDKTDGRIHQVGTEQHDSLIFIDGKVEYENMQNCDGTGEGDGYGYEFVPAPDPDDYISVTPEQLYLNRKLIHRDIQRAIGIDGE